MGYYSGNMKLEFDGTNCEKTMMEKLLQLMEPGSDWKWTLPVDQDYDFFPATALLGLLKIRDDGKYCISGVPEYTFAPKLFAALFPASRFIYSIVLEYSVTLEDTPYLTAVYENNELMMRDSILYNYGDEEKIAEICKKMIEIDPEAREKYEQYLKETASEDYEDVDWLLLLENLVDDPCEKMASLYDYRIEPPSRNKNMKSLSLKMATSKNTLCANK